MSLVTPSVSLSCFNDFFTVGTSRWRQASANPKKRGLASRKARRQVHCGAQGVIKPRWPWASTMSASVSLCSLTNLRLVAHELQPRPSLQPGKSTIPFDCTRIFVRAKPLRKMVSIRAYGDVTCGSKTWKQKFICVFKRCSGVAPEWTPVFTTASLSTLEMPSDNRLGTCSIELTPWL